MEYNKHITANVIIWNNSIARNSELINLMAFTSANGDLRITSIHQENRFQLPFSFSKCTNIHDDCMITGVK